jgi:hypothetical protein
LICIPFNFVKCYGRLDYYKSLGANLALISLWGGADHENYYFALKLDQSRTGGWLNNSYPCAMFDPYVGQGMYSKHGDHDDLCILLSEYSRWLGGFAGRTPISLKSKNMD